MDAMNQVSELKLEIISKCPQRCRHCSSESSPEAGQMADPALIEGIAGELIGLGGNQVALSGGEPLEHPELMAILRILRDENLAVLLYTTGLCQRGSLHPLDVQEALDLRCFLRSAVFSLQGGSASVHDMLTGMAGSFDMTIESLRACKSAGIDVALHFVPTKLNYQDLPDLVALAERLGILRISLLRFVPHGRGASNSLDLVLTPDQLTELRSSVVQLSSERVHLRLGSPFRIMSTTGVPACQAGIDRMLVTPDGKAYPCDAFKGFAVDDDCQNVYTHGLTNVWRHSRYFRLVRDIVADVPDGCRGCYRQYYCRGGCIAQRALAYGSLNDCRPDPCCLVGS